MPITHEWLDDGKTLIYIHLEGRLGAEDFLDSDAKMIVLLDTVAHPVDVIIDYSAQVYFSPDYVATTGSLRGMTHENIRLVVFVGNKLAWDLFGAYVEQFQNVAFEFTYAPTVAEGRAVVQSSRTGKRRTAYRPDYPELN